VRLFTSPQMDCAIQVKHVSVRCQFTVLARKYSSQIMDVLIGREKLIEGIDTLTAGVKRTLVCGPFE
jgi:hypothetical protein